MIGGGHAEGGVGHLNDLFYLSMALCVHHHSNREMGTAMYELQERIAGPSLLTKCWSLRGFSIVPPKVKIILKHVCSLKSKWTIPFKQKMQTMV